MSKIFSYEIVYDADYEYNNTYATMDDVYDVSADPDWDSWPDWGMTKKEAKADEFEIKWKGWMKCDGVKDKFTINNMQANMEGKIWGHGSDEFGKYKIRGKVLWEHHRFKFKREYSNDSPDETFKGKIVNGHTWIGTFKDTDDDKGTFQLQCCTDKYKGCAWQDGVPEKLWCNMDVYDGIYGNGKDEGGQFIVRGHTDDDEGLCWFYKQYHDGETILFHGVTQDNFDNITGRWKIQGERGGRFHLHR